jgi:hypothetical protein
LAKHPYLEGDMALNETDKSWIRETITNANKAHGWGKLKRFIKEWSGAGAAIAILLFGFSQWSSYIEFRTQTNDRLNTIEGQLKSVRETLDKNHAEASLAQAALEAKYGDQSSSISRLSEVGPLLGRLADNRVGAPPSFFQSAVGALNTIRAAGIKEQEVSPVSIQLAQYRSALNSAPDLPAPTRESHPTGALPGSGKGEIILGAALYPDYTTVRFDRDLTLTIEGNGGALDCRRMHGGQEIFLADPAFWPKHPATVRNLSLIGGTQTLDYVNWENVTFVGTHINYRGGVLRLKNVRFVGCTFEAVPDGKNSIDLLNSLALGLPSLSTGEKSS